MLARALLGCASAVMRGITTQSQPSLAPRIWLCLWGAWGGGCNCQLWHGACLAASVEWPLYPVSMDAGSTQTVTQTGRQTDYVLS